MKPRFTPITIAIALAFNLAWFASEPNRVAANERIPGLTPSAANRLSRDLAYPSPSQNFFQQGQQMMEKEIRCLQTGREASSNPGCPQDSSELLLDNKVNAQGELDRLPQLRQDDSNNLQ